MKIVLIISLFFTTYIYTFSQAIVQDPGAIAQLVESVKVASQSANSLHKQTKILEDTRKSLSKVSSALRTVDKIKDMVKTQHYITKSADEAIKRCIRGKNFTVSELQHMIWQYTSIANQAEQLVKVVNQILKDDLFKMSDSERLKHLKEADTELESSKIDIQILNERYQTLEQQRQLRQAYFDPKGDYQDNDTSRNLLDPRLFQDTTSFKTLPLTQD